VPVEGRDGNFTTGAAGFLISCIDSGAASHRGAARVLGTCTQREDVESRGGFSAFIWPLWGRYFLCHFWIRDGLLLRRSVSYSRGLRSGSSPGASRACSIARTCCRLVSWLGPLANLPSVRSVTHGHISVLCSRQVLSSPLGRISCLKSR